MKYDDRVHKYVAKIHASVVKKRELIKEDISKSRDLKFMWHNGVKMFNKIMATRIENMGFGAKIGEHG